MDNASVQNSEAINRIRLCKTFYEILGVAEDCSKSDIKKAFRILAVSLHPDKNHAPGATSAFRTITKAMEILTDDNHRRIYDSELRKTKVKDSMKKNLTKEEQERMDRIQEFEYRRFERSCQQEELARERQEALRVQNEHRILFEAWKIKMEKYLDDSFSRYGFNRSAHVDARVNEDELFHTPTTSFLSHEFNSRSPESFEQSNRNSTNSYNRTDILNTDWISPLNEVLELHKELQHRMRSSIETKEIKEEMMGVYEKDDLPSHNCRWRSPSDAGEMREQSTSFHYLRKNFKPHEINLNNKHGNLNYKGYSSLSFFNKILSMGVIFICFIVWLIVNWCFS